LEGTGTSGGPSGINFHIEKKRTTLQEKKKGRTGGGGSQSGSNQRSGTRTQVERKKQKYRNKHRKGKKIRVTLEGEGRRKNVVDRDSGIVRTQAENEKKKTHVGGGEGGGETGPSPLKLDERTNSFRHEE